MEERPNTPVIDLGGIACKILSTASEVVTSAGESLRGQALLPAVSSIQSLHGLMYIFDCANLIMHMPGHVAPYFQAILWLFYVAALGVRRRFI